MNERHLLKLDRPFRVDQPAVYRIDVQGHLTVESRQRFDEMAVTVAFNPNGVPITSITGLVIDQSALHGILARIRDLAVPIIHLELLKVSSRDSSYTSAIDNIEKE